MNRKYLNVIPAMLLLFAILFSCRPDILLEQDARNQAAQSGLTSKIISLKESAHRNKILPELKFAKQQLTNKSINPFGKTINFGDSISIDTEGVIYIENGPNYHTYTFNIKRTNPQANDPVENLLLAPLPNGTYQEFFVSYNLSVQEKQKLIFGHPVDTKGKTLITELTAGTMNSGNHLAKSTMVCVWKSTIVYQPCKGGAHNETNFNVTADVFANWANCKNPPEHQPSYYINTSYSCEEVAEAIVPIDGAGGGGDSGGPGGGGGDLGPAPDPCVNAASNPGEVGLVDGNGCAIGVPTQPNVGPIKGKTPCELIKKTTDDAKFIAKKAILKTKVNLTNEVGYKLSYPMPGTNQVGTQDQILENYPGTNRLNFNYTPQTFAILHSHHNGLYPIFSPDDLIELNKWIAGVIAYNADPNNTIKINVKELTISVVTETSTYLMSFDSTTIDAYPAYTQEEFDDIIDDYKDYMIAAGNSYQQDYMEKLEYQFLKFTEKYMPMPKMKLFEVLDSGNFEISLVNGKRKRTACP
ncbi:hypothetical protein [Frigoriflavimonas asaccharolytica]|uniref:Uncharacterized protein n=1 Tax=Frigoriflavimonas asaccharolytica TaxID=2735899 RepID=A0A8J8K4X5_9FLAO|nr:hypothetical protein [Frigoriflavimonas asaccharolytica]NRS92220.1 hypothetical protein [Frigoriflavimonas asaccharolytica]